MFLATADNQYGFKPAYGPNMCIFALKRLSSITLNMFPIYLLHFWMRQWHLNHCKLLEKLLQRNITLYILRILWY